MIEISAASFDESILFLALKRYVARKVPLLLDIYLRDTISLDLPKGFHHAGRVDGVDIWTPRPGNNGRMGQWCVQLKITVYNQERDVFVKKTLLLPIDSFDEHYMVKSAIDEDDGTRVFTLTNVD